MLRFLDISVNIFLLMFFDLWYNDYNILEFMGDIYDYSRV